MTNEFDLSSNIICDYEGFQIYVSDNPIGGYESRIGTLTIDGIGKKFQDLTHQDCIHLAIITNTILRIFEDNGIKNSLIYGRHTIGNGTHPIFSIVPYASCGLMRKIWVDIHIIFGSNKLKEREKNAITDFYREISFEQKFDETYNSYQQPELNSDEPRISNTQNDSGKLDAFCRRHVLNKQRVVFVQSNHDSGIEILADNLPKVPDPKNDIHLLSFVAGQEGHVDGSEVPIHQRADLFYQNALIAKEILGNQEQPQDSRIEAPRCKFKAMILLESNGELLRGINHQHFQLKLIQNPPKTLSQIIKTTTVLAFKMSLGITLSDTQIIDNISYTRSLIPNFIAANSEQV